MDDLVYDLNRPADKKEARWPCSFRDLTTFDGKIIKVEAPDPYTVKFTTPVKIAIMPGLVGEPNLCSKKKYASKVADGSFGGAMSSDAKTGTCRHRAVDAGRVRPRRARRPESATPTTGQGREGAAVPLPRRDPLPALGKLRHALPALRPRRHRHLQLLRGGKDIAWLKPKQEQGNFKLYQLGPDHGDLFLAAQHELRRGQGGQAAGVQGEVVPRPAVPPGDSYAVDRAPRSSGTSTGTWATRCTRRTAWRPGPFRVDVPPIPRDLDKAKALLADMGLKEGPATATASRGRAGQPRLVHHHDQRRQHQPRGDVQLHRDRPRKFGMKVNSIFLEFNQTSTASTCRTTGRRW